MKRTPASNYSLSPHLTNFDIVINEDLVNDSSFYYDESGLDSIPWSKYDFYSAILHELGHAIGLKHVIDTADLMHAINPPGPLSANKRKVKIQYWNQEGADTIMHYSTNLYSLNLNCSSIIYEMDLQTVSDSCRAWPLAVQPIASESKAIYTVYPNPFSSRVTIEFFDHPANAMYEILDIQGRKIYSGKIPSRITQIELDNMPSGVYLLNVKNQNQWSTVKIISAP